MTLLGAYQHHHGQCLANSTTVNILISTTTLKSTWFPFSLSCWLLPSAEMCAMFGEIRHAATLSKHAQCLGRHRNVIHHQLYGFSNTDCQQAQRHQRIPALPLPPSTPMFNTISHRQQGHEHAHGCGSSSSWIDPHHRQSQPQRQHLGFGGWSPSKPLVGQSFQQQRVNPVLPKACDLDTEGRSCVCSSYQCLTGQRSIGRLVWV